MNHTSLKNLTGTITSKKYLHWLFIIILLINISSIVYIGFSKVEYHVDELYSYVLSNSYDAPKLYESKSIWNQWIDGDSLNEFITVQPDETFSYSKVYYNNSLDAHPPLYYFLLHTICSLFPNSFSKWYGIVLNLVFFVASQVMLYIIAKNTLGKNIWALLPCAIYGGTMIGQDAVVYIRMYILLTFFTLLLLYLIYQLFSASETAEHSRRIYIYAISCGIVTFLGTFTHYYFALFAFYAAAFLCLYLLLKKLYVVLLPFSISMLMGVFSVFFVYPAGITQITGSSTNNVGNEVAANILVFDNLFSSLENFSNELVSSIFAGFDIIFPFALVILLASVFFSVRTSYPKTQRNRSNTSLFLNCLTIVSLLSYITIVHISGQFNYIRYIYHVYPIIILVCVYIIKMVLSFFAFNESPLIIGIVMILLLNSISLAYHHIGSYLYLDTYEQETSIIQEHPDSPVIVLNNHTSFMPTALLSFISNYENIYLTNWNDECPIEEIIQSIDTQDGYIFIILSKNWHPTGYDTVEVIREIKNSSSIDSVSIRGRFKFSHIFYTK